MAEGGVCACASSTVVAHALVFKAWVPRYLLFVLIPLVVLMGIVIAECVTASVAAVRHRFRQPGDWRVVAPMIGVFAARGRVLATLGRFGRCVLE